MKFIDKIGMLGFIFCASLSLLACKDSENAVEHENSGNQEELANNKDSEKGIALLEILSMTAGLDSLPDNWYRNDFTVEPTVGVVNDKANPYVRYIVVSNVEEAVDEFNSMLPISIPYSSTQKSWSMEGIGSLNFKVMNASDVTATIDVNIKQLPHLTQIRLVPVSAMGNNYTMTNPPYYQFGDVVSRQENGKTVYWICARPASKIFEKGESHWVSFQLNDAKADFKPNFCIETKKYYLDYVLPTNLGDVSRSKKYIPYFFRLMMILNDPDKYKGSGFAEGIGGIGPSELTQDIVEAISENWEAEGLWDKVFKQASGGSINRQSFIDCFDNYKTYGYQEPTVNFFYGGKLYIRNPSVYLLKMTGENMEKKPDGGNLTWSRTATGFDFHGYAEDGTKYGSKYSSNDSVVSLPNQAFIVRYCNGAQLENPSAGKDDNDKHPSVPFTSDKMVIKDVYVYKNNANPTYGYSTIGDIVENKEGEKYVCAWNFGGNDSDKYSYFIGKSNNDEKKGENIKSQDKIVFNILNACIVKSETYKNNKSSIRLNFSESYKKALQTFASGFEAINNGISLASYVNFTESSVDGKYVFSVDVDFKQSGGSSCYTIKYDSSTDKYSITISHKMANILNIISTKDINSQHCPFDEATYTYQKEVSGADRRKAKIESVSLYNTYLKKGFFR